MEKIKPQLVGFLPAGSASLLRILTIGKDYLAALRDRFPNADLFAVVPEDYDEYETVADMCSSLDIDLTLLDIYAEPLPFAEGYFDYIVSDLTLEKAANPQDIAAGFGQFLKPTGAWLTSFRNIRHWSVWEELAEGHYYNVVSRLYAKQEFERLLYASFYKEVRFRPQRRYAESDIVEKLVAAGFDNLNDDLNTEFWLVSAARSMPELALLKSMYDGATRQKLSRILHRIEYDVNAAEEVAAFWQLCDERKIFADYAAAFAEQTVFHRERFYSRLARCTDHAHREKFAAMVDAAMRESLNEQTKIFLAELKKKRAS